MSKKEGFFDRLKNSVVEGNSDAAKKAAEEAMSSGVDPMEALNYGLMEGIREVGERFSRLEMFLTDMMFSAEAMQGAISILKRHMSTDRMSKGTFAKIILSTVEKDVHDIGKNLVGTMLSANGFEVYDLGVDVPGKKIVEKAEEVGARIVALSALMSTTRPYQRDVVKLLKDMGLRHKYGILVGGGCVTAEWAQEIAADGYAKDAVQAAEVAKQVLEN